MWQTIGDRSFCTVHNSSTDRGVPCAQCVADPSAALSDRDVLRVELPRNSTAFYEDRLMLISERCEKIGDELLDANNPRKTVSERTEPAALAAKFYEVAARCIGRCVDVAAKREDRAELDELKKTIREMRGAH